MYGVDIETFALLRYSFGKDQYVSIGLLRDENGIIVDDIQCLALAPAGPFAGLYGVTNFNGKKPSRLVKISRFDASAKVVSAPVGPTKVEGLVATQDRASREWRLLAACRDPQPSLLNIDPSSGKGSVLFKTRNRYVGLAADHSGMLYGVTREPARLWKINPAAKSETLAGDVGGYRKVEALEFAFGDDSAPLRLPLFGWAGRPRHLDHQRRAVRLRRRRQCAADH